ncbi:hypothetical protein, partial [Muricomes intestini]|uniref:hypothetical protein n=1 Tax=Muricomes intestini TaxID=1796634 RepID=UPI002FE1E70A
DNLIDTICSRLNATHGKQRYSEDVFLVGRDYLEQVLLEGGECEVIGKVSKNNNRFPSDYEFDTVNAAALCPAVDVVNCPYIDGIGVHM